MTPAVRNGAMAVGVLALGLLSAPAGIVALGVVIGCLNALLAIGLVLVYRTNRIVNFAHGELGGTAAVLTVLLVLQKGWNFFAALAVALIGAAVVGAVLEATIIRRSRNAPRLLVTVATIGLAELFSFASLLLPTAFDRDLVPQNFRTPLSDLRFRIDPVTFDGNHLLIIATAAGAAGGLTWFFRRSALGNEVLASAEARDLAELCGIPTKALSTLVWAVAAALSATAAILQAPVTGLSIGVLIGPGLLLRGLAAAVLGRMTSLPTAVGAAIGLGVFEQVLFFRSGTSNLVDFVLFFVILVGLASQKRTTTRVDAEEADAWKAVAPIRPIPAELAGDVVVRRGRPILIGAVAIAAVGGPALFSVSRQNLASSVAIWAIVGVSLVTLTGWAGQISLGQFALVGIGAATAGTLTAEGGIDFVLALTGGGVTAAAVAVLLGLPAIRLRGLYMAVTTLAFAVATASYVLRLDWVAPDGVVDRPQLLGRIDLDNEFTYYLLCLTVLAASIVAVRTLRRSRAGRVIVAGRDNALAAQAYGIGVIGARLWAFAFSGFIAGVAGGLLVHHQRRLQLSQYGPEESLSAFTMTVIGGLGSVPGAVLGAIYVRGARNFLPGDWDLLATGAGVLLLLILLPNGLGALVFAARDRLLRVLADHRGIVVASLVADRGVAGESGETADKRDMAAADGSSSDNSCPTDPDPDDKRSEPAVTS